MNELLKKLTSKNNSDAIEVAKHMVDDCDVDLYKELVEQDSFLFDFVKRNVAERIYKVCNEENYRNLIPFLKYYSPSYDEAIVSVLAKFADEDLTDEMLELFDNGNDNEKCYCAKFFSYIQDSLALDLLRENSYTDNESLNANCAATLGILNDSFSYEDAIAKLDSADEFEKLSAVKFLVIYGNKAAVGKIIDIMKTSTMSENIAGYIPYIIELQELINNDYINGLIVFNNIINGLGEILGLYEVINFEMFNIFEDLLSRPMDSALAVVLLNSYEKFNTLTENDEYMFDEDKNTQAEVKDIKKLLGRINRNHLKSLLSKELEESSPFVYTALELTDNIEAVRELLRCNNQTLILKTAETLKKLGAFDDTARTVALVKITDENIKSILRAL
jgi:HEAT repeat protein